MPKKRTFVDTVSYGAMWLAITAALLFVVFATVTYIRTGSNDENQNNIANATRLAIFAILVLGYRKIVLRK